MTLSDRFAAFRPADAPPADLFGSVPEKPLSHSVPLPVGHEKPQKTAVSHVSHASHQQDAGSKERFPLTAYMVALMRHPNIDQADPIAAAKRYGLSEQICRTYLDAERRRRWAG